MFDLPYQHDLSGFLYTQFYQDGMSTANIALDIALGINSIYKAIFNVSPEQIDLVQDIVSAEGVENLFLRYMSAFINGSDHRKRKGNIGFKFDVSSFDPHGLCEEGEKYVFKEPGLVFSESAFFQKLRNDSFALIFSSGEYYFYTADDDEFHWTLAFLTRKLTAHRAGDVEFPYTENMLDAARENCVQFLAYEDIPQTQEMGYESETC
jgi:hypothetical protein